MDLPITVTGEVLKGADLTKDQFEMVFTVPHDTLGVIQVKALIMATTTAEANAMVMEAYPEAKIVSNGHIWYSGVEYR